MQHAFPGRQVIAFVGDGGFAMLMAEFLTAVRNELPIKVVVNNNNSYGQILWEQMILGYPEYAVRHRQPEADFAAWAAAAAASAQRSPSPATCRARSATLLAHHGPALVDCDVNPNEPPMPGKVDYEQAKHVHGGFLRGQPHKAATVATVAQRQDQRAVRHDRAVALPRPRPAPGRPRRPSPSRTSTCALERDLRAAVDGEVRFDAGSRGAYSTDASNYRQVPIGVVVPARSRPASAAVAVCRRHGAPLLSRGGGTSLAGECTNTAVVIDWSKYCNRLLSSTRTRGPASSSRASCSTTSTTCSPEHDLEFGPEPATHDHCTLGGMIGNNSCGATAQRTGKVVDNIVRLEVLLYDGTRMWVGATPDEEYARDPPRAAGGPRSTAQLRDLRDELPRRLRTALPRHPPPGLRLQPRLAAAREGLPRRPGAGRLRGHARHGAAGRAEARTRVHGAHRWSSSATPTSPRPRDAVPASCRATRSRSRASTHS